MKLQYNMTAKRNLVSKNPNSKKTSYNLKKETLHLESDRNHPIRRTMFFSGKTLNAGDLRKEQNYLQKKGLKAKDKPLYIFDFSGTSKYVGKTEKNLKEIFKILSNSNGVLLFDEADALFGKRTKVKDSHDKYANLETSYILKKLQNYKGIKFISSKNSNVCSNFSTYALDYLICLPINNS